MCLLFVVCFSLPLSQLPDYVGHNPVNNYISAVRKWWTAACERREKGKELAFAFLTEKNEIWIHFFSWLFFILKDKLVNIPPQLMCWKRNMHFILLLLGSKRRTNYHPWKWDGLAEVESREKCRVNWHLSFCWGPLWVLSSLILNLSFWRYFTI